MDFLWTDGTTPTPGEPLREDVHTEVCVIGGGMAGVLCAAQLTAQGIDNVLLEARLIGEGITKGTTAVLTAQHATLYRDIANLYGMERAQQYLRANLDALAQFRALAQHINCALETRSSVMYSLTGQDHLQEKAELLHALGFDAMYTTAPQLPLPVADAVIYPDMAQFHPLRILNAMAKGLRIYEHTFVTALAGTTAVTAHDRVHAKRSSSPRTSRFSTGTAGIFRNSTRSAPTLSPTTTRRRSAAQPRTWAAATTSTIMATCCSSAAVIIARAAEAWDMRPQRPLRAPGSRACTSGTAGRLRTACCSTASPISAATAPRCRTYMWRPGSTTGA